MKIKGKISSFVQNAIRVLKLATKPKKEEFWTVAKITGLGIIVLGLVGYVVDSIKYLLR